MVALRSTLCLAGGDKATFLSDGGASVSFNLLENLSPSSLLAGGGRRVCPEELALCRLCRAGREEDVPWRNAQSLALGTARDRYSCRARAPAEGSDG